MTSEPEIRAEAAGDGYEELLRRWGAISDLGRARALLAWDERTKMPRAGAEGRAEQLATLTRIRHELLTGDGLWELIESLAPAAGGPAAGTLEADAIAIARRTTEKARRVPAELRAEMARAASRGESAWELARESSDLAAYLPHLERNIELAREYGACFPPGEHPYDALLDDYEPGMTTAETRRILGELADGLVPLVAGVAAAADAVDEAPLRGRFEVDAQRRAVLGLIGELPLEPGSWRLDPTQHPFMTSISPGDLRLTTRYDPDDLSFAVFSALHEAGHAIYEAGVPTELRRGPIGHPASLSFHESQSRLWENWVGRSRPFLARALPLLERELGPGFAPGSAEALYRAANRAGPSLIRIEADEVTYNLHIVLRFELELGLIEGSLAPADLPEAWAEATRRLLGLEVPDHRRGLMQDAHWAAGSFGYFPTYALGNVIAGQLWELAGSELGDPEEVIAAGELEELRRWLVGRVHRHAARWLPDRLAREALGEPLDPAPLLARLGAKYGEIYDL